MSRTLTPEEIDTAVQALPGWSGGPEGLRREIAVGDEDKETLVDAIRAVAAEQEGSPRVETHGDGLQVVLASGQGSVTEADVELAGHLDRLFSGGTAWDRY